VKQARDSGARNNHNNASRVDLFPDPGGDVQNMSHIPADIENRQRQRPIRHGRKGHLVDTSQKAASSFE
jgi:hypothetical protein